MGAATDDYRIVCIERTELPYPKAHAHVTAVGTGGWLEGADQRWSISAVVDAIRRGVVFYTIRQSTGEVFEARIIRCGECRTETVTSKHLYGLRPCNFG